MPRNSSLDVLRGIAVLLTIGSHMTYYPLWHKVGWTGVDLFFVLSGFLVSGLLFQDFQNTGRIEIGRFILRRGLKIWPAFYVFLLAMFAVSLAGGVSARWLTNQYAPAALYYSNYVNVLPVLIHTWSLAVEEHFYLFLPCLFAALIWLRPRRPFAAIPLILLLLAAICLYLRWARTDHTRTVETHLRMDSLFFGVGLSYVLRFRTRIFAALSRWPYVLASCLCLFAAYYLAITHPDEANTIGFSLFAVGFSLLVAWMHPKNLKPLSPLATIGRYSYSIYLWHLPVMLVIKGQSFVQFWCGIGLSLALGIVMAKVIELPVLRLRDKWIPSSTRESRDIPHSAHGVVTV